MDLYIYGIAGAVNGLAKSGASLDQLMEFFPLCGSVINGTKSVRAIHWPLLIFAIEAAVSETRFLCVVSSLTQTLFIKLPQMC